MTGFDKRGLKSPLLPADFAFLDTVIRYEFFQVICFVYGHNIAFRLHPTTFRHTFYSSSFSYPKIPREVRRIGRWGGAREARINLQLNILLMAVFHVILSSKKKNHSNVTSKSRHQPPAFVSSGVAHFGSITATAAAGVGFSHSMMQSVQLLCRSRVWSTWPQVHAQMQLKTCTVFVILREFATSTPLET